MLLLLRGDRFHPTRIVRAGCIFLWAALSALSTYAHADGPGIVVRELHPLTWADARQALLDAMTEEGLAPPATSPFGEMLARTAPDLGHRADFYGHAEIFSFCSAQASARLIAEDVRNIALCPMTMAMYTLPDRPGAVFLAWRLALPASPAGEFARALLVRIADRSADNAGLPR